MPANQSLIAEVQHEAASTRKLLERVPAEHLGWKPHEKSMTLSRLASHISDLPEWIVFTIEQDELDFATAKFEPFVPSGAADLVARHDANVSKALKSLENLTDEQMKEMWTLRNGDRIILQQPKAVILRSMCLNHLVHHRGQLSVFLRLLNVPIPGMYGPSADEMAAMAAN
jgi:uncharacterized damage-inducible protein DinB